MAEPLQQSPHPWQAKAIVRERPKGSGEGPDEARTTMAGSYGEERRGDKGAPETTAPGAHQGEAHDFLAAKGGKILCFRNNT